jgi:GxxExxY protein
VVFPRFPSSRQFFNFKGGNESGEFYESNHLTILVYLSTINSKSSLMYQLTDQESYLAKHIVDAAYKVHSVLGPGLLEKIYEACFCHELTKKGIAYQRQVYLPVYYDGLYFDEGIRCDVFVEELILCELKALDTVNPLWEAQLLSQLTLTNNHVGFIINFNVIKIKDGIRRYSLK